MRKVSRSGRKGLAKGAMAFFLYTWWMLVEEGFTQWAKRNREGRNGFLNIYLVDADGEKVSRSGHRGFAKGAMVFLYTWWMLVEEGFPQWAQRTREGRNGFLLIYLVDAVWGRFPAVGTEDSRRAQWLS